MNLQNKNTIYNIVGVVIKNVILFFSIPFFASILGSVQYGIISTYKTWVGLFTILFGLQISGSIGAAKAHFNLEELRKYFSSVLLFGLLFSSFCIGIGYIFNDILEKLLLMEQEALMLMGIQATGMFVITFSSTSFIFLKKAHFSVLVQILPEILGIVISLSLITYCFSRDAFFLACMYGSAIPIGLLAILLASYFIIEGDLTFRWKDITFCMPICLPLIFHGLFGILLAQSDRLMLQHMRGNEEVGIYSFIIIFSSVLMSICTSLNNTWVPFYYDDLKDNKIEIIRQKSKHYIYMYCLILDVFILCAPEVIEFMVSADFLRGIRLLPLVVFGYYFSFLYSFPVNFQFYHMKTYYIAFATIFAACVNVGINYITIPSWGMDGAAFATMVSQIALFLFHEYVATYVIDAPYHYDIRFFSPGIFNVCAVISFFILSSDMVIVRWGVGMIFAMLFVFNIYRRKSFF